jgi:hypothetical protein
MVENFTDFVNEQNDDKSDRSPDKIRKNSPGYVGEDFAKKASDEDLLAMVELLDKHANIYNSQILPIKKSVDALRKKYKLKPNKFI